MHQNNADMIRPGCRGGHDQFNWESLRTMKYHDREQYLGQTTIIGYLDKGGKWRKKDWYIKPEERALDDLSIYQHNKQELKEELQKIKDEDERRIKVALGIEQPDDQKIQQVKLTKEEIAQLTKKTKIDFDDELKDERKGLGNGPMLRQTKNVNAQHLLEAYGMQEEYKVKREEDGCIEKKIKKEKKEKKDKKGKKEKDESKHKKDKKKGDEKKEKKRRN